MTNPGYVGKLAEAQFHLDKAHTAFLSHDPNLVHSINAFLSAAQSVIWTLNKSYSARPGYSGWQQLRSKRLPDNAKAFKELRNVSVKEGPVENKSVVIGFQLGNGSSSPGLGPLETFTSPLIDRRTGEVIGKGTVTSADGKATREVDALAIYDFGVEVISDGKTFSIGAFVTSAKSYLNSLQQEALRTEEQFS